MTDRVGSEQSLNAPQTSAYSASERETLVADLIKVDGQVREKLDAITRLATSTCDTPIGVVSLVGRDAQTFLGRTGLDALSTPREWSFCSQAMLQDHAMVVPDALLDARFQDNPLVTGEPHIRFYAGHPLHSKTGMPLGSLCVIDTQPKDGLSDDQLAHLKTLADAATLYLENWAEERSHGQISAQAQHDIDVMTRRFATLAEALPQLVWSTPSDGMSDYFNNKWVEHTGQEAAASYGTGWMDFLHPEDLHHTQAAWHHSVKSGEPYEIEYRLRRHDGQYIWMLARGLPVRDAQGKAVRWIGTCTDINERVATSEALEMMSRELSHRIKNLFSVVQSLVTMGLRQFPEMSGVSRALQSRMVALGRAHDLVRPRVVDGRPAPSQTMLRELLAHLVEPFQSEGTPRVVIAGTDVQIGDSSATPMALFLHEMLTNSAKYGALSTAWGTITLTIESDGETANLLWQESGSPPVVGEPKAGFGTRLIQMTIERQMAGRFTRHWAADGLILQAFLPLAVLRAH